jgi:ABC-2 type transport system ATP-binding protein
MAVVIRTEKLTKYYGPQRGVIDLDLEVHAGEIFGYLGPNGAGKTTTIRLLLDFIRPTRGRALVFDTETTRDPVAIHGRTGYLPGEFSLYDRLTGGETIAYFANLRRGVDPAYQRSLVERLDLDPSRRYREYSKGNKQKVALVVALQHRPELLVLDEPTAGLDPLVQLEFQRLLAETKADSRTVLLSSHLIGEVERSCDRVAIIREGRVVQVGRVEALRDLSVHEVVIRFADVVPVATFEKVPGVTQLSADETSLRMRVSGPIAPVLKVAAALHPVDFTSREPTLEEVFLTQYEKEASNVR